MSDPGGIRKMLGVKHVLALVPFSKRRRLLMSAVVVQASV